MEIWDGYLSDGSLAGVDIVRGEPIPDGLYFLAVEILVRHTDGDYLLMQRDHTKPAFAGYYEATINLDTIQALAEAKNLTKVGMNDFIEAGYVSANQLVKVLGNGSLTTKLEIEANAFSKSAVAAIEAVGGNAVKL